MLALGTSSPLLDELFLGGVPQKMLANGLKLPGLAGFLTPSLSATGCTAFHLHLLLRSFQR